MIWLWVLVPLLSLPLIVFGFSGDMNVAALIFGLGWFLVVLAPTIRQIDHNIGAGSCREYGVNAGREVQFFDNSYFDYGCYVKTANGWVDRDKVGEFEVRP